MRKDSEVGQWNYPEKGRQWQENDWRHKSRERKMRSFRSETLLRACRAPSESEPLLHYSSQVASLAVLEPARTGLTPSLGSPRGLLPITYTELTHLPLCLLYWPQFYQLGAT